MSEGLEVTGLPSATPVVEPKADPPKVEVDEKKHEETVPYDRFQKANLKAKERDEQVKSLRAELDTMREQLEMKSSGATDVEQMAKRLERAEARAAEMQEKADAALTEASNTRKERWVASAAAAQNFTDPSDASVFVDLSEIESERDAERAIKRLAGQKKYLVKVEERQLPGKVMENGKPVQQEGGAPKGLIDPMQDATTLVEGLVQFASPEAQRAWREQRQQ